MPYTWQTSSTILAFLGVIHATNLSTKSKVTHNWRFGHCRLGDTQHLKARLNITSVRQGGKWALGPHRSCIQCSELWTAAYFLSGNQSLGTLQMAVVM